MLVKLLMSSVCVFFR